MHSNDNGSAHGCNISLPKLLLGACPMFLNTDESLASFLVYESLGYGGGPVKFGAAKSLRLLAG